MLGPVSSPTAGASSISRAGGHLTVVRALGGRPLATVRVAKLTARALTLTVTAQAKGPVTVWACVVRHGVPVSCTPARTVRGHLELTLRVNKGDSVQLVAVRRR